MNTQMKTGITVVVFGDRRVPRSLATLPVVRIDDPAEVDAAADGGRRLVVVGDEADLGAVLSRLMRKDLLDIEVAHVRLGGWDPLRVRRALSGAARRVPLIRDDTGSVLVGAARWVPPGGSDTIHGEAVVDDTVLFDGAATEVRIEPTPQLPGLRATVLGGSRRGWVTGRAAQLGTTGALVVRDGVPGAREVKRSTFYRHTTGWLRVD